MPYQEPPEGYSERLLDLNAGRIVRSDHGLEIYGTKLDGSTAWIWIHLDPQTEVVDDRSPLEA